MQLSTTMGTTFGSAGRIVTLNPGMAAGRSLVAGAIDAYALASMTQASILAKPRLHGAGAFSIPAMFACGTTPPSSDSPSSPGAGGVSGNGGGSGSRPIDGNKLLFTTNLMKTIMTEVAKINKREGKFSVRAYEAMEELFGNGVLDMETAPDIKNGRLQDHILSLNDTSWRNRADGFEALSYLVRKGVADRDKVKKGITRDFDRF